MNQKQVLAHMTSVLDWNAREYDRYEEKDVKESIAKEFKAEATAFNTLLRGMYKTIKHDAMFTSRIETYIMVRKCDNWK